MEFKRFVEAGSHSIPTIETEKWEPHPEKKGMVRLAGMRTHGEVFDELKDHLAEMGMLPDEYFLAGNFDSSWEQLPKFKEALCNVNFGGSEGIYLDIYLVLDNGYNSGSTELLRFATGKTLHSDVEAFYKMSMIAGECSLMLNGRGDHVRLGNRNLNISLSCVEREVELERTANEPATLEDMLADATGRSNASEAVNNKADMAMDK